MSLRRRLTAGAGGLLITVLGMVSGVRPAAADIPSATPSVASLSSWFNWVDHASPGMTNDNIHLLNPGSVAASGSISVAGTWSANFNVPAGGEAIVPVPYGVIGGPAQVVVSSGPGVIASQRVTHESTLSEVAAARPQDALTAGYFAWYDLASPGMTIDNVHVLNPGAATAQGTLSLPGSAPITFSVPAGGERYYSFPFGTIGGPLSFHVTSGPAVVVSQRVTYQSSFDEILAQDPARASTRLYFNWYDQASPGMAVDDIHIVNPGSTAAAGTVSIPGGSAAFSVPAGADGHVSLPGHLGGPAVVAVTSGPAVLASQRLSMPPMFSEWWGRPAGDATADSWFNWYDRASPGFVDDVHVANPGSGTATVKISVPGAPVATVTVDPGQDSHYSFPQGTIGGPLRVQVTSGPAVLASHRNVIQPGLLTSRTLAVPYYHQNYELSCEEAALRMALAWEGIGVSEDQILNAIGIDWRHYYYDSNGAFHWGDPYANVVGDPNGSEIAMTGYGTYASTVERAARGFGGQVLGASEGVPPSAVYQAILDGHPVVAWVSFDWRYHQNTSYQAFDGKWVQFGSPYEHAVTVVGVTSDSVLVNNPWSGQQWVSKSTFEAAYATFNYMAVTLA